MVRECHPSVRSGALCVPPVPSGSSLPFPALHGPSGVVGFSQPPSLMVSSSLQSPPLNELPLFSASSASPNFRRPPVRDDISGLLGTKLFHTPDQPVRRVLFAKHLHGCPYNDEFILGMTDHPTPPSSKHRSRLECNCAKLLEQGHKRMEEDMKNAMLGREFDVIPSPVERKKGALHGKVCATLSWSSPLKRRMDEDPKDDNEGDGDGDYDKDDDNMSGMSEQKSDERQSEQREGRIILPLPAKFRLAAQSHYNTRGRGSDNRTFADRVFEDNEMEGLGGDSNFEQETPDKCMARLTLQQRPVLRQTSFEESQRQENSDADDCDTEYDTETEIELQYDHYQNQHVAEDECSGCESDDDGGFWCPRRGQQTNLDNRRKTLTALTGGPKMVLWFPTETLTQSVDVQMTDN